MTQGNEVWTRVDLHKGIFEPLDVESRVDDAVLYKPLI